MALVFITVTVLNGNPVFGGTKNKKITTSIEAHRIVFQLSSGDSLAHKSLMKQLNNFISIAPKSKIEVVCHGPGLDILVAAKINCN